MEYRALGDSDLRVSVASAIDGASRPEQLGKNAAVSGVELDDGTMQAIDAVFA